MRGSRLASLVAALSWILFVGAGGGACATGVDSSIGDDDGGGNGDDVGVSVDATGGGRDTGHPSSSGGSSSGSSSGSSGGQDAAASGDGSTSGGADGSAVTDSPTVQPETGGGDDAGTTVPDTGTTQPDASTQAGICPSDFVHGAEATLAIASGKFTTCGGPTCGANLCCYTPVGVCVGQ
jgi:hypothetical protein